MEGFLFHIALDFHIPVPVFEVNCAGSFSWEYAVQLLPVALDISTQDEIDHNIPLFNSGRIEERTINSRTRAGVDRSRGAGKTLNICDHIVLGVVRQLENLAFGVFNFQCKKAEQIITSPF